MEVRGMAYTIMKVMVFPFERPKLLALLAGALIVLVAIAANASCNTLPERMQALCSELQRTPDCVLDYEPGFSSKMTLVVAATDFAHEALTTPAVTDLHATSVTLVSRRVTAAEVYQRADEPQVSPQLGIDAYMKAGLPGPSEADLISCPNVLDKLLWQSDNAEMGEQLRAIIGCSGVPYISRIYDRTCQIRHNGISGPEATVVSVDVMVRCAVPRT